MGEGAPGPPSRQRVSVDEAARVLGLTVDAVRKRVQRGTIKHEKDQAGRVRILLDSPDNTSTIQDDSPDTTGPAKLEAVLEAKDEAIEDLRDRVRSLERQLDARQEEIRRRDILLANLVERVPQLEAPSEARDSSVSPGPSDTATPAPEEAQEGPERPQAPRSLWSRIFGW